MPEITRQSKLFIRLGSHSEKEYVEKTMRYLDGVIVGANLFSMSPGATASLLFRLTSAKRKPYYIDPMTYAFGAYLDPESGLRRDDLDWIKSEQKLKGGKKGQTIRTFKSSYRKLADDFGSVFSEALDRSRAISNRDFPTEESIEIACTTVLNHQASAVRSVFAADPETEILAAELPLPRALIVPYFYIEEGEAETWIELNRRFALSPALQRTDCPTNLVICCHKGLLCNTRLARHIIDYIKESRASGVWLWFSRFDERTATPNELRALCTWIRELAQTKEVYNMHGGYFSLALSKLGLSGIAHGVGYGEQKDVVPVIGQSTPTVQYYVRPTHSKFSVPQVTRCFSTIGIQTSDDFFAKVCGCVICRGVIGEDLENFAQFGEIHYSTPDAKRLTQTPAAAKRCRFHFLLNRIKERDFVNDADLFTVAGDLAQARGVWSRTILDRYIGHLQIWPRVLDTDLS